MADLQQPQAAQTKHAPMDGVLQTPPGGDAVHLELPEGFGAGWSGRAAFAIALAFTSFQIWVAAYGTLPSQVVRAMHVGFLLLLGFALLANLTAKTTMSKVWLWACGVAGFGIGLYHWVNYVPLIMRSGFLTHVDLAVGVLLIVLVFDASRRVMGWPLAIVAGVFLAYCFFGQYMPGPFVTRGYDLELIIEHFAYGTEGVFGTPIYVASAYIFIFVVFAAFLERAGMIALFNDVALGLVGGAKGGPAQVPDELAAYNPLIPQGAELVATVMFEIDDPLRRARVLAMLGGVENQAFLRVGADTLRGVAEGDQERSREDGKASAVQFVRFAFTPPQVAAFRGGDGDVVVGFDHPNYGHMAVMPPAVRQALAGDFA